MAGTVYRSTDVGAPPLTGETGQMIKVLDAILVNGYGATATGTLTSDNTNVSDGETVTINGRVYTFKTTLDMSATCIADQVLIGANADASLANLVKAVNLSGGVFGTDFTSVYRNMDVVGGSVSAHAVVFTSRVTGTAGNSVTTTETSAHLSWGGATMSGGTTATKTSAGWTKEYTQAQSPVIVNQASNQTATAAPSITHTLSISSGYRAGDLILMLVTMYDTVAGGTTPTMPGNWFLIDTVRTYGTRANGDKMAMFGKWAVPSDITGSATVVISNSASNNSYWQSYSLMVRGIELGQTPVVNWQSFAGGATTPQSPAITVPGGQYTALSFVAENATASPTGTNPSGWSAAIALNNVTTANQWLAFSGLAPISASSGTQGPFSWSLTGTYSGGGIFTIAFKPQTVAVTQAVYRPASGPRHYLRVNEEYMNPLTYAPAALAEWAVFTAYESMTDANVGTNLIGSGTITNGSWFIQKSGSADATARPWAVAADGGTVYFFALTGITIVGQYEQNWAFGEFYSYVSGDSYKTFIAGSQSATSPSTGQTWQAIMAGESAPNAHWVARSYVGATPARSTSLLRDACYHTNWNAGSNGWANGINGGLQGGWQFPNQSNGAIYLCRNEIAEAGPSGSIGIRGRLRGINMPYHDQSNFIDGDVWTGTDDYAGKTLHVIKPVGIPANSSTANTPGAAFIEVGTAWDSSS
jgi:hypothetical protein